MKQRQLMIEREENGRDMLRNEEKWKEIICPWRKRGWSLELCWFLKCFPVCGPVPVCAYGPLQQHSVPFLVFWMGLCCLNHKHPTRTEGHKQLRFPLGRAASKWAYKKNASFFLTSLRSHHRDRPRVRWWGSEHLLGDVYSLVLHSAPFPPPSSWIMNVLLILPRVLTIHC